MDFSVANILVNYLKENINDLFFTGSYFRQEPKIKDLDIITKRKLEKVLDDFIELFGIENIKVNKQGKYYMKILLRIPDWGKVKIDIWYAENNLEYFYKKTLRNLDKGHAIYWHNQAKSKGYHLSENGLYRNDKLVPIKTIKKLKEAIGIKKHI